MTLTDRQRLYELLGARIRKHREDRKLSQGDLAKRVSVKRVSIINIEKGQQQTPLYVLYEIADALEIDLLVLLPSKQELGIVADPIDVSRRNKIIENTERQPEHRRLILEFVKKIASENQRPST